MKKMVYLVLLILALGVSCASTENTVGQTGPAPAQTAGSKAQTASTVTVEKQATPSELLALNEALQDFAQYLKERLPPESMTAVARMDAPVQALGNYIVDELLSRLVNDADIPVVSRQDWERIQKEQNIQTDVGFDDETTAKIGHNLGWKTIIFGEVSPLEIGYRIALRAVDTESGALRGTKSYLIQSDAVLANLINPNQTAKQLTNNESLLQPFKGEHNNFELRVWPSSNNGVYYDNEELFINLWAAADCYFVIYQVDVENRMQVIYPNFWETGKNMLKAGVTRRIPEDTSFVLHAPYGEEQILVYASQKPFTIPEDQYNPQTVTKEYLSSPQALWRIESDHAEGAKALSIVPRGATGQFSYSILPK
jgi:hypothetical protein